MYLTSSLYYHIQRSLPQGYSNEYPSNHLRELESVPLEGLQAAPGHTNMLEYMRECLFLVVVFEQQRISTKSKLQDSLPKVSTAVSIVYFRRHSLLLDDQTLSRFQSIVLEKL